MKCVGDTAASGMYRAIFTTVLATITDLHLHSLTRFVICLNCLTNNFFITFFWLRDAYHKHLKIIAARVMHF
jgi:hypothetical protein